MLATVVSLAFATLTWAHDDDDYYYRHDDAREHGYSNGYRDGMRTGQYDAGRGRHFKFKNDDWEDAHGYQRWMGDHGQYKRAYREGYENGYRRGYGNDRDRDGYRWRDRDDWR
jgi:hypothetical protein